MRNPKYDRASHALYRPSVLVLALALALAAGCYPGTVTDVQQLDLVGTLWDANADWGTFQTYVMPDTVIHLVGEDQDMLPVRRDLDQDILDLVRANIEDYGYVLEPDPETNPPDVVFLVSVTASENWYGWIGYPWWDYWGWWPGWGYYPPGWGPGWGWGYPCCGNIVVGGYTTGTLFVDMVDANNADIEEEIVPILWTAAMNGLVVDATTAAALSRLTTGINQAFAQSPYLEVNP
ncbi:MAG: DUF4136 domain-containing protein [Gemmatimonadota bacterium]|nr:MAG: DUF4136 domain-containing protein [Gemmatimonadota bacterium]